MNNLTTTNYTRPSDAMDLTACEFHAERTIGDWTIERHTVEDRGFMLVTPPGTYTGLKHKGQIWMSDVPDEKHDHAYAYLAARQRGGRCLVHGLGLGMVVKAMADLPNVEHVDVVELDHDVIELCGQPFRDLYADRVTIHQADALAMKWPRGSYWTVVWHDIWPTICADNLEDMRRLHRSFGQRCDWQGSWARDLCERSNRGERIYGR